MKKILLSLWVLLLSIPAFTQLLSWTPAFPTDASPTFEITMDATKGNKALDFYTPTTDVYVHIGVITNLSPDSNAWRYVRPGNFNSPVPALNATYVGSFPVQKWKFTITGGIRNFFGVPAGETIQKIGILFRNGAGVKVQRNALDGSNMYIPINNGVVQTSFSSPLMQPTYSPIPEPIVRSVGSSISLTGNASVSSNLRLLFNGVPVATQAASTTISASPTITAAGLQTVQLEATNGITVNQNFNFFVPAPTDVQPLPAGVKQGINYEADQTAATLVLYAPNKTRVSVIG
ncbi:MAG: hypothetical protein EOO13_10160, partial [Chitinophagaceae bacterium]